MRRFLQLARGVPLAQAVRYCQPSRSITNQLACRPLAISSVLSAKSGDSGNDGGSDRGDRKKGFFERAGDRLSAMSGMDSHSNQATISSTGRQTRSIRQQGSSLTKDARAGDASNKMSKKASSKLGNHRAMGSVRHEKDKYRFILDLGGNETARIDYKPIGKNMIEMYHTEVPDHLRGRGIGKALAKGAFECASRSNLKLKVTCEYLEDYVKRFAEEKYRKLIAK